MSEELMAERYGSSPKRRPRWMRPLLVVLVLAIGMVIAYIAYRNLGAEPISTEQKSFDVTGDSTVSVVFTVTRDQPERAVDCIVRARGQDGGETGRREVFVPAGTDTRTVTTTVTTSAKATTSEIYGCSYNVPTYLSAPPRVR